jgi:hypothetical protein
MIFHWELFMDILACLLLNAGGLHFFVFTYGRVGLGDLWSRWKLQIDWILLFGVVLICCLGSVKL